MKLRRADMLFILLIALVLLCLRLLTTGQTTLRIPRDDDHRASLQIYTADGKKAAEKECRSCHGEAGMPLTETHPPQYRCMFCHKPAPAGPAAPAGAKGMP